jgi:hypothetical protein
MALFLKDFHRVMRPPHVQAAAACITGDVYEPAQALEVAAAGSAAHLFACDYMRSKGLRQSMSYGLITHPLTTGRRIS